METTQLIVSIAIGLCVLLLVEMMTRNKVLHWINRGCISSIMIIVMNCLLPQYMIGFNVYTVGFSTLLGFPGLMTLYLLKVMI